MRRTFTLLSVTAVMLTASAFAQVERTPQPAPELKQLNYFLGTWKTEADMKPGPMGPGGKFTSTDVYKWQEGNFFLIANTTFQSPMGGAVELMVFGYDPAKKAYTYDAFVTGEHNSATGTLQGDTLTWTNTEPSPFKWHYIEKMTSPTSFTIKFEGSQDGTNWMTLMEGKSTKQ